MGSLAISVILLRVWPVSINDNFLLFVFAPFGLCRLLEGSLNQFTQGSSCNLDARGASAIKMFALKTQ